MRRLALSAASLVLAAAAACGGSAAAPAPFAKRAPEVLTQRHHGKTFTVRVGRELSFRLPSGSDAEPRASSRAVDLSRVDYVVDPGFREWIVGAQRPGRVVVSAVLGARTVRIVLLVRR
jgi:hypothetical protein